jgi:hypothetical protein
MQEKKKKKVPIQYDTNEQRFQLPYFIANNATAEVEHRKRMGMFPRHKIPSICNTSGMC